MVLLHDVGQVEACFGLFGDGVNLNTSQVHGLRQTYHRLENYFRCIRTYSLVMWLKWKLVLVYLEIVLISAQVRCKVYVERTIGSEIILDAHDGTPR